MTAILAILSKVWGFITSKGGEYIGIALAALGAYVTIKKSGENVVKMAEMEETLKDVQIKKQIIDSNANVDAVTKLQDWKR